MGKLYLKVGIFSFFVNVIWEFTQSPLYTKAWGTQVGPIILLISTFGDAIFITFLFWILKDTTHKITKLVIASFCVAVATEFIATTFGFWEYSFLMPRLFSPNIGFLPSIQLAITALLTYVLLRSELEQFSN